MGVLVLVLLGTIFFFGSAQEEDPDLSPFNVTVGVGNTPPVIISVSLVNDDFSVLGTVEPRAGDTREVNFTFIATDDNSASDLEDSTADAKFERLGVVREGSCVFSNAIDANSRNYSCSVDMWYFDAPAIDWNVNATISDGTNVTFNDTTFFTYITLASFQFSPDAFTFGSLTPPAIDSLPNENPMVVNNTGNVATPINITGVDLAGVANNNDFIFAGNFSINVTANGCEGQTMVNGTTLAVSDAVLAAGNLSAGNAMEDLYYCITAINPLPVDSYTTTIGTPWEILIAG